MPIYYVDLYNGVNHNHAASGLTWSTAYKTMSGLTSRVTTITGGDTIRVSKTEDPKNTGINALWTGASALHTTTSIGGLENAKNITGSSNTTPISISATTHGYSNGDVVHVQAHTTNLSANGYWIITGITTNGMQLVGSIGMGTGGVAGTITRINPKVILLDSPLTKNITTCDYISASINNWTPGTNVTSSNLSTTIWKEGYSSVAVITGAAAGANQILAKSALPASLDLSAYSGISFWFRIGTTAPTAGQLQIKLYSDTGCTSEVESFDIPGFTASHVNYFEPVTINKGSALSSTVQGIAVYATAAFASKTFYFDNFIAVRDPSSDSCISHTTLLSKNSLTQINSGNTEGWYGIKAINDTIVVIDNDNNSYANTGAGYYGATENVPLYKREPFNANLGEHWCYVVGSSLSNLLNIEYGYTTGTTTIDGETWLNLAGFYNLGFNSYRYTNTKGFLGISRGALSVVLCNFSNLSVICSIGLSFTVSISIDNIWNLLNNNCQLIVSSQPISINHIYNMKNSIYAGTASLGFINASTATQVSLNKFDYYCNNSGPLLLGTTSDVTLKLVDLNYCGDGYGALTAFNTYPYTIYITSGITNNNTGNGNGAAIVPAGAVNINGCGTAIIYNNEKFLNGRNSYIIAPNKIIIKNFKSVQAYTTGGYFPYGCVNVLNNTTYRVGDIIIQDTGTTYNGVNSWKMSIGTGLGVIDFNYERGFPLVLTIGRVYVAAGSPVSVSVYMKNSSATAIGAKLYMAPYQLSGQTELQTYSTGTDWTKVTLPTFTPQEAGVIEIQVHAWYINSTTVSVWVDSLEVIQ